MSDMFAGACFADLGVRVYSLRALKVGEPRCTGLVLWELSQLVWCRSVRVSDIGRMSS